MKWSTLRLEQDVLAKVVEKTFHSWHTAKKLDTHTLASEECGAARHQKGQWREHIATCVTASIGTPRRARRRMLHEPIKGPCTTSHSSTDPCHQQTTLHTKNEKAKSGASSRARWRARASRTKGTTPLLRRRRPRTSEPGARHSRVGALAANMSAPVRAVLARRPASPARTAERRISPR